MGAVVAIIEQGKRMQLLLGVGFGMALDAAAIFFLCDRKWGWFGSTPMLCFYGFTLGVIAMLIAGSKLART